MRSGDPEVLPSGLPRRSASVDLGSTSEEEVELPVSSESAVPTLLDSTCSAQCANLHFGSAGWYWGWRRTSVSGRIVAARDRRRS